MNNRLFRKAHKNEQRLQDEKHRLEAELGTARQDCVTLNEELTARVCTAVGYLVVEKEVQHNILYHTADCNCVIYE